MTDKQKLILQKSLTRSAKKAQKHWVRGLIGHTETEQGFFAIESIPITNYYKNKVTTLAEFMEDAYLNHNKLSEELKNTNAELMKVTEQVKKSKDEMKKLVEEVAELQNQIKEIATFNLG